MPQNTKHESPAGGQEKISGKELILPPRATTAENTPRRVGVELEFGDISPEKTADIVRQVFGGTLEKKDPYRIVIR